MAQGFGVDYSVIILRTLQASVVIMKGLQYIEIKNIYNSIIFYNMTDSTPYIKPPTQEEYVHSVGPPAPPAAFPAP